MRHEIIDYNVHSADLLHEENGNTKLPSYDKQKNWTDVYALSVNTSLDPDREGVYSQSLLSHEIIRMSSLDTVLKNLNSRVFEEQCEVNIVRGFPAVPNTPSEEALSGKPGHMVAFNAICLDWENISPHDNKPVYYRVGVGIKDGNEIAPFFVRSRNGYAQSPILWTELMQRKRPYAFLSHQQFPIEAPVYPIIQNGAITTSVYFADLRQLAHNGIAGALNASIAENTIKEILPPGVKESSSMIKLLPPISHKVVFSA